MVQNIVPKEYGRVVAYLHSVRLFDFGATTLLLPGTARYFAVQYL
jgi:hypothetical protein